MHAISGGVRTAERHIGAEIGLFCRVETLYFAFRNRRARDAGQMQNASAGPVQSAHRTRSLRLALALAAVSALPGAARAEVLLPDGATLTSEAVELAGAYAMPIGAWSEASAVPTETVEGRVARRAWRLRGTGMSSYQILVNLRQQLLDAGYEVVFECEDRTCGGFDFRFGTEVINEPEMHVDLGDYRFLSAVKPGTAEVVTLMVSRSASAGFIQVIEVGETDVVPAPAPPMASTKAEPGTAMPAVLTEDIGSAMEKVGRFILGDLVFATGSADLGPGDYGSLAELAGYLNSHPEKRVALVGHTDAEGSLGGNISLSKRRAASVKDRLVNDFGVSPGQLEAEGIGYLAPIASNQTDDGRTRNRRVEAILVSTE